MKKKSKRKSHRQLLADYSALCARKAHDDANYALALREFTTELKALNKKIKRLQAAAAVGEAIEKLIHGIITTRK